MFIVSYILPTSNWSMHTMASVNNFQHIAYHYMIYSRIPVTIYKVWEVKKYILM